MLRRDAIDSLGRFRLDEPEGMLDEYWGGDVSEPFEASAVGVDVEPESSKAED